MAHTALCFLSSYMYDSEKTKHAAQKIRLCCTEYRTVDRKKFLLFIGNFFFVHILIIKAAHS